ncbi:MAG: hypothetical protein U0836_19305 [Pirellulales bacterium]
MRDFVAPMGSVIVFGAIILWSIVANCLGAVRDRRRCSAIAKRDQSP